MPVVQHFVECRFPAWMYSMSTKNALQVLRSRGTDPTGAHSAAHRGADSRCPRISSRERNGGSGPDRRRCNSDGAPPYQPSRQLKKQWRFYKYSSLIEWVDVPVDEHIDDSCDCTADFQIEMVNKERYARSLMTVSLHAWGTGDYVTGKWFSVRGRNVKKFLLQRVPHE